MYNIKVLKYPSGWQYRVYSKPVGFRDDGLSNFVEREEVFYNPFEEKWEFERPYFYGEFEEIQGESTELKKERSKKYSMNRTINRVYHLARSNVWEWFVTLTFAPEKVNSFDYDDCVNKLKRWIDSIRRFAPDLKYIFVPEKHESGRFHFHGLMANCDGIDIVDSGHKDKKGRTVYNIGKYKLGFSNATKVSDNSRVTKYISKYITKELCAVSAGKKRYWCSRNLDECEKEEIFIEGRYLDNYVSKLLMYAKHHKFRHGMELTTLYIETDAP